MQSSRIDASEDRSATCSIRSRNVCSPHWMSSNTTTSGRSAAACSSVLRKAHAISSAEVAASLSPSSERIATAAASSGGEHVELLQHLDDRPVGDPLAVRGAAARTTVASIDARNSAASRDLPTPASPMTVTSSQRRSVSHALPRLPEDRELALAPDEPRTVPPLRRLANTQEPEGGNRLGLALQLEGLDRLDLGRVSDERERRLSDQHLARLRRLLQPRRDVDRIAGRQPLLGPRHHLAGHDADPSLEPELGQRVPHLHGRTHRAQRVVLVQHRHAEHGHHGVADELLHGAAVPLDDRLHPLEVAREQRAQPFGIERLAERGRAGQVAEQHGHRLALLAGRSRGPLRAALRTEPERSFRLEATRRTGRHAASLGRQPFRAFQICSGG